MLPRTSVYSSELPKTPSGMALTESSMKYERKRVLSLRSQALSKSSLDNQNANLFLQRSDKRLKQFV